MIETDVANKKYSVPNLVRALAIFEFLSSHPKSYGVTEIAEKLSYPKNSVFRIVKTLALHGYLIESGKSYHLSAKLLALGSTALEDINLSEKSIDIMRELRDVVNETVLLGILKGSEGVILDEVLSTHPVKFKIDIGHVYQLNTASSGKVILAYLPELERDRIIDNMIFKRYTKRTIINKSEYLKALATVKQKGYALNFAENYKGLHCVAAPIFNHRKYPIASIWLAGPSHRLLAGDLDRIGEIVKEHAYRISQRFGYEPQPANY